MIPTATIADFLLARIGEDEAVARRREGTAFFTYERVPHANKMGGSIGYWLDDWQAGAFIDVTEHIARHDPARVLAECAAKRRIVELFETSDDIVIYPAVAALAAVYADHTDYRSEWAL